MSEPPAKSDASSVRGTRRWGNRIIVVLFAVVAVPVGGSLLYNYAPTDPANSFYPGCTFYLATGLHCPGCGATRCCHALVHGEFAQAFAWNPLFVVMLPVLILGAFQMGYTMWTGKPSPGRRLPGWSLKIFAGILVAFWIARNIPVEPLTLLAPHKTERTMERERAVAEPEA